MDRHRQQWEAKWSAETKGGFGWYTKELPSRTVTLLTTEAAPPEPAVDIGCGDGILTE